jgi:hypothetical protein
MLATSWIFFFLEILHINMNTTPTASPPTAATPASGGAGAKRLLTPQQQQAKYLKSLSWFGRLVHPLRYANESKLAVGLLMILMNIGMKYVDFGFSKTQEQALRNGIAREMIIFAVCFMGTRDIFMSLLLTGTFMLLADVLFHDGSKYCIVPKYMQRMKFMVDKNQENGTVTHEEEKRAREILDKAERSRHNTVQANMQTYLAEHV